MTAGRGRLAVCNGGPGEPNLYRVPGPPLLCRNSGECERIDPNADFGRGCFGREETVLSVTIGVKPGYLSLIVDAVNDLPV